MSHDESSPTVPAGSADGEPTPGISTVLQALVAQIKSMNDKMDSMGPVELSDGELNEEEDQNEDHEGSVLSIDTRLKTFTTRTNTETTATSTQSSQALKEIAEELDVSEKTGSSIDEELSQIVKSLLKDKLPAEKTQAKINAYPRPDNVEGLRSPRLNPLIWNQISAQLRTQDSKHQKTQQSIVAAITAITKVTNEMLKQSSGNNKELLTCLTDAIALSMNAFHDVNTIRRQAMKNDLHRDYAALCLGSAVEAGSEYLFGNLSKLTKDISEANKLTKRVRPTSNARGRRRAYNNNNYQSSRNGQRNRLFTPYSKSRSDFLYKGHPPSKVKKEGQGKN